MLNLSVIPDIEDSDEDIDDTWSDDQVIDEPTDDLDPGETEREQDSPAPQTPTVNWDDEKANPYVSRFKGLQGTVQQQAEELKRIRQEQETANLKTEAIAFNSQIQHLSPEEQQGAWQQFMAAQQAKQQLSQAQMREREVLSKESMLNEYARDITIWDLSQQYGVPAEELADFDDLKSMTKYAERYSTLLKKQNRTQRKQQRRESGADSFDAVRPVSKKKNVKAKDLDEAASNFAKLAFPDL